MKGNIACCGVDCAACSDYINGQCPGCRDTVWQEDPCMPVSCCLKRNISSCGQCGEFPCAMMAEFYQESGSHRQAYERMKKISEKIRG